MIGQQLIDGSLHRRFRIEATKPPRRQGEHQIPRPLFPGGAEPALQNLLPRLGLPGGALLGGLLGVLLAEVGKQLVEPGEPLANRPLAQHRLVVGRITGLARQRDLLQQLAAHGLGLAVQLLDQRMGRLSGFLARLFRLLDHLLPPGLQVLSGLGQRVVEAHISEPSRSDPRAVSCRR